MIGVVLALVAMILAPAILPAASAHARNALFLSDLALLLVSPVVFWLSGSLLQAQWLVGWGGIVYPFLALAVAVGVLYLRVFVIDRVRANARDNSLICLLAASVLAAIVGALIPPWYD